MSNSQFVPMDTSTDASAPATSVIVPSTPERRIAAPTIPQKPQKSTKNSFSATGAGPSVQQFQVGPQCATRLFSKNYMPKGTITLDSPLQSSTNFGSFVGIPHKRP